MAFYGESDGNGGLTRVVEVVVDKKNKRGFEVRLVDHAGENEPVFRVEKVPQPGPYDVQSAIPEDPRGSVRW